MMNESPIVSVPDLDFFGSLAKIRAEMDGAGGNCPKTFEIKTELILGLISYFFEREQDD